MQFLLLGDLDALLLEDGCEVFWWIFEPRDGFGSLFLLLTDVVTMLHQELNLIYLFC